MVLPWSKISTQRSIVSQRGTFVKNDFTPEVVILKLAPYFKSSSVKEKESLILYLFTAIGSKMGTKNFSN